MKQVLLILLLMGLGQGMSAQDQALGAKIIRLLEVSGARGQFLGAIDNFIAIQRQSAPADAFPADFWGAFSKEVHEEGWNDLQPRLLEIYQRNFTEKEIDFQIAYYENPIAQGILAKQGNIMQESMSVGAEWGQQLGEKISRKLQEAKEGNQ